MAEDRARILMLTHRNIVNKILARCAWFEFEDIVNDIDSVDMLAPSRSSGFDATYRRAARVGRRIPVALNPGIQVTTVEKEYELFFTLCVFPSDLLYVNQLKNWRSKCRVAVCWIDEMFPQDLKYYRWFNKIISKFDFIIFSCSNIIGVTQAAIDRPCHFLLPGVDALLFCPYPDPPERFIDVLSIGRRSQESHDALIRIARERRLFYYYDTISGNGCKYGLTASDMEQHRMLLANLVKRSKYFLVNPGKFDLPGDIGGEEIIGARYFEGAASGAIMIGGKPKNPEFDKSFPWPNPVLQLGSGPDAIEDLLDERLRSPERQEAMRINNVFHSLREHDWAYRWEAILKMTGLEVSPLLAERKRRLEALAKTVLGSASLSSSAG